MSDLLSACAAGGNHQYGWQLSVQEDGWKCIDCDLKLPFSPEMDRKQAFEKVNDIAMQLHMAGFVYFSNSSHGLSIVEAVAKKCQDEDTYDQLSIIGWLLDCLLAEEHREFWQKQAKEKMEEPK